MFSLLLVQNFIFASECLLKKTIDDVAGQVELIDRDRDFNPRAVRPMAYDELRNQVIQAMQVEETIEAKAALVKTKRESCCYYCFGVPVAILASVVTFDTTHSVMNGMSRMLCVNTMKYGNDLLKKKNQ